MPPSRKLGRECVAPPARTASSADGADAVAIDNFSIGQPTLSETPASARAGRSPRGISEVESQAGLEALGSGSSLIRVTATKLPVIPRLPSQLPRVEDTCSRGTCYLPPAEEAHVLLTEYLHDYNSKIPLYAPESLYNLFRDCYAGAADNRPLAWVLVYTTIAMTYRLRAMSVFAADLDTQNAEWYLNACLSRLPDLLIQTPCIRLAQACVAIAWLLETSSRSERAPFFAATALRLATDLGYNDLPSTGIDTADDLEARYVFWLAFFIDTHFNFTAKRAGSLRVADIATPVPAQNVSNWWNPGAAGSDDQSQSSVNVFALHCSLAVIEASAAEDVFSVQARKRSDKQLAAASNAALKELHNWRQRNPLSAIAADDIMRSMYRSDIVLCIVLEAAYFRTSYQLQATRALGGSIKTGSVFSPDGLRAMMQIDPPELVDEAEHFLRLALLMPQGNVSTTWYSLCPIVAAYCTLLSPRNIDASDQFRRQGRLQLCETVLQALDKAREFAEEPAHEGEILFCHEVMAIAVKL